MESLLPIGLLHDDGHQGIERVLKPGGRFQIADVCVDKPVSEEAKRNIDLWTG